MHRGEQIVRTALDARESNCGEQGERIRPLQMAVASVPPLEIPELDDSDDEGSLVDFIDKTDEVEASEGEADDDDEGISVENIIYSGKRKRRAPVRYEDEVFASKEYRKMMLCDIPDEEMHAALVDTNFSEDESEAEDEEADDPYEDEEEDSEEDEEEDEEEDHEEDHEDEGGTSKKRRKH